MKETVIIIGTAPTLNIVPWDNPDADYWACAPVITHPQHKGHRIDALFEMHPIEYWTTIIPRLNEYCAENKNCKIYMQQKFSQIINSEKYPLAEVQTSINHPKLRSYFTSTIAYMVGLAIASGYKKIELYGVHMASQEEEYSLQRPCLEALLALAWGRGIDFWLPDESDVFKSVVLYGYQQENGTLLKLIHVRDQIKNGEDALEDKLEALKEEYWVQKGGRLAIDKYIQDCKKRGVI